MAAPATASDHSRESGAGLTCRPEKADVHAATVQSTRQCHSSLARVMNGPVLNVKLRPGSATHVPVPVEMLKLAPTVIAPVVLMVGPIAFRSRSNAS
jgi:hypothetical protein